MPLRNAFKTFVPDRTNVTQKRVVKYLFTALWFFLACVCLSFVWRIDIAAFDELEVITGTVADVEAGRRGDSHELIRLQSPQYTFRTDFTRAGISRSIAPGDQVTLWVQRANASDAVKDVNRISGVMYQIDKNGKRLLPYQRVVRTQQFLRVIYSMGTVLFLGVSMYFGRNLRAEA